MKDEEMAEQFADNISGLELTCSLLSAKDKSHSYRLGRYDGFLAGLKAGRPQWHKMDYNDEKSFENIPRYIELLTKYSCGLFEAHCINKWTGDHWCEHSYGVIAWCEIPTFDKE